jgi:hypothetical protein
VAVSWEPRSPALSTSHLRFRRGRSCSKCGECGDAGHTEEETVLLASQIAMQDL